MISALPFIEETLTSARTPQSTRTIQLAQMKKVQMDQDQSNLILNAPDFVLSLSLSLCSYIVPFEFHLTHVISRSLPLLDYRLSLPFFLSSHRICFFALLLSVFVCCQNHSVRSLSLCSTSYFSRGVAC